MKRSEVSHSDTDLSLYNCQIDLSSLTMSHDENLFVFLSCALQVHMGIWNEKSSNLLLVQKQVATSQWCTRSDTATKWRKVLYSTWSHPGQWPQ